MASIPESNNREIAITGPISGNQLPTDQISKGLLLSLERGWYDAFDIRDFRLSPVKETGALRSESRFLQIFEVPSSPENTTSGLLSSGMQNVISSLRDGSHSFIYAISSLHGDVSLLTGVRHYEQDIQTKDYIEILYRSLRSNYPGIVFNRECNRETSAAPSLSVPFNDYSPKLLEPIRDWKYLSCITGIPSLRDTERYSFSQSIDRLVDALQGETYLLMVIAEPILDAQLSDTIAQLRFLGENVHKLVRQTISESHGEQRTTTDTRGETGSIGLMHFLTWAVNKSRSIASSESTNRQISAERIDKTAQFCEQLIDHYIQRFQLGRSLGFWNVGVYLASPDYSTAMRSQSMARSLYSGEKTHYEPIRVLELSHSDDVKNAIANLHVPVLDSLGQGTGDHPLGRLYQSLGTPLTTEELSILVSFPSREVPGLKIKPVVDFNLNPPPISGIRLGTLLYRGSSLGKEVAISPNVTFVQIAVKPL